MLIAEVLIGSVLFVWLVLSVLRQFSGRVGDGVASWDFLYLLPIWNFFAPTPGSSDYRLLYQDTDADGVASRVVEVPSIFQRSLARTLWNPRKRLNKGVRDMADTIIQIQAATENNPAAVKLSIPYLALVNFVCSQPRGENTVTREFILVESHGYYPRFPNRIIFRSDAHRF